MEKQKSTIVSNITNNFYRLGKEVLRKDNPMINLNSHYDVFVAESELQIFVTSTRELSTELMINIPYKVFDGFTWCNGILYFSHYNADFVSSYRIFESTDPESQNIYVEFAAKVKLDRMYLDFNIDSEGRAITFTGRNTINYYRENTAFNLKFQRQFPMYRFFDNYVFYKSPGSQRPMMTFLEDWVYVLMINEEDPKDKKMFIYNKLRTSHDVLYKIIDLDQRYAEFTPYMFAERIDGFETVSLYILYNRNNFQYFEYRVNIYIVPVVTDLSIQVDPTDTVSFNTMISHHEIYPLRTDETQVNDLLS
jgi:hypothetical protein